MGSNSGLTGLLVTTLITCCSPSLPPPFLFNSPLHGNNGEALLHIVSSPEEVFPLLHNWQARKMIRSWEVIELT